ncbi:MAG: MFS transporter [Planctomycetaceae bacterium]|nr:MFS transporter [Planctomycetaceae bacterium]
MVAIGLQQTFFVPFLDAMGANRLEVGIGAGLPSLMTGIVQIWVPALLRRGSSYKKLVVFSVFAHAFSFLPFSVIAFGHGAAAIWLTMIAVAVNAATMGLGNAAWSDWMSYLVPRRRRGKYFAMRNRVWTFAQLAVSLAAGRLLDTAAGKIMAVFALVWGFAFFTRLIGGIVMNMQYEPAAVRVRPEEKSAFRDFVFSLHTNSFGQFVLAFSLLNLGAYFSSPFFPVYMLNDLHLSYLNYTILQSIPSVMIVLTMSFWGKLCDRIGYVMPMRLFSVILVGLPLVWVITRDYWLLVCSQMLAGISWGGMQMTSFNYTLDAVGQHNRLTSISYLNVITGICMFLGSTLGGIAEPILPQWTSSPLHNIFIVSSLLRIVPVLIFQALPTDKPRYAKMTATERFFFDPRLSLRNGFDRLITPRQ